MLAAADAADGKAPPPRDLALMLQWRALGTPPEPGGLLDQRAGLLHRGIALENIYNAVRAFNRAASQTSIRTWSQSNPDQWRIVQQVIKLREQ